MRNFTLVLMCWISLTLSLGDAARTCSDFQVPPCPQRADRDILFLLDTSESMNPARFYSETLDFTQAIYCAFDQRDTNRAGIVTFSATIREAVPFQAYSILDWFAAVEVLRATPDVCCRYVSSLCSQRFVWLLNTAAVLQLQMHSTLPFES